jgi:hypothetical protein
LRCPRTARFIGSFLFQQLGVRQDDAELIVQLVKELPQFPWLFHSAPLEQICNRVRETIHFISCVDDAFHSTDQC